MFPCVLKCQFVSKGIHSLIVHTKISLKNFNDSAVPTVPVLALKVASRIAIYISKDSRASWRSVICRGQRSINLEVSCVLPPSSFTSEQMLRLDQGWDELAGRTGFTLQICGRRKHRWRELPRTQEDHQGVELALKLLWPLEEMKNSRRKNRERERGERREANWKEGGRQAEFPFCSIIVVAQEQIPSCFELKCTIS